MQLQTVKSGYLYIQIMHLLRKIILAILLIPPLNLQCLAQHCIDCGQGASGYFLASKDTQIQAGNYDFDSLLILEGVKVSIAGNQPMIIRCKGQAIIEGTLVLNGENGANGQSYLTVAAGGAGVAGGYDGAQGAFTNSINAISGWNGNGPGYGPGGSSGAGAGAGFSLNGNACNRVGGAIYGDSLLSQFYGGSGGGSGLAFNGSTSGGGGGGGGILILKSCEKILLGLTGKILCNGGSGGNGSSLSFPGGGGSGGSIYLSSYQLEIYGSILALGGSGGNTFFTDSCNSVCNGSPGRIRLDAKEIVVQGSISPTPFLHKYFNAGISRAVNVKCFGTSTGFIKARASGGDHPYTYLWSNGSNSDGIDNIAAGAYTVTITDASGCSFSEKVNITQPDIILPDVLYYPPSCESKSDGYLLMNATGGTPFPYQKSLTTTLWSNCSSEGIMFDISVNTTVKLKRISLNLPSTSQQLISVYFKQGSLSGAEFDSSQWQLLNTFSVNGMGNDEETPLDLSSLDNLLPGHYSLYIYNHNGKINCVSSSVLGNTFNFDHILSVYEGMARGSSGSAFNAATKGIMNLAGRITYVVRQENNFKYNFVSNSVNSPINNTLPSGIQQYKIADALGCEVSSSLNVPAAKKMNISLVDMKNPRCNSTQDGRIEITALPAENEKFAATPIPAAIPSNGICLNIEVKTPIHLNGIDLYTTQGGTISLYLKSGSYFGYENINSAWTYLGTYTVNNMGQGGISSILLNSRYYLNAGNWSLLAYSSQDLISNLDSVWNFQNNEIDFNYSSSRIGNIGAFQTTEKLNAHFAGTLRYYSTNTNISYLWNTSDMSNLLNGIGGGTYSVEVNQNDCKVMRSYLLTAPEPIKINENIHPESENNQNGSIHLEIEGGTPPYYIQWLNNGITGNDLTHLTSGNYPLFIADANGCTKNDTLFVHRIKDPEMSQGHLEIAPNPNPGLFLVVKAVNGMEDCNLEIFDHLGRLTYKSQSSISTLMTRGIDLSTFADGSYIIRVKDQDQVFNARFVINR